MEDSERVRAACLRYLQDGLVDFYPERTDIIEQMRQLAAELGGHLDVPRLAWKYASISAVFGPSVARRARVFLPRIRWAAARLLDRVRFAFE